MDAIIIIAGSLILAFLAAAPLADAKLIRPATVKVEIHEAKPRGIK